MEYSLIHNISSPAALASRGISIILTDDGSLHEYPYNKFVSPIGLKKAPFLIDFIEKEFGINKNNQLILRNEDGKQLESSMNLEEFFQKDRTVYVFLNNGLRQEIAQDDFEVIGAMNSEKKWGESGAQLLSSIYENFLGSNVRDTLEPHIVNYYDHLMAAFSDVKWELTALKEGSLQIKRQKNSEAVLKRSLLNYYFEKKRKFDETLAQQEAKINTFQEYFDNFDSCIKKLSEQEIEPRLGEEEKKYLVNYFDLEKLNRSKGVYEKNQIKIQQKAQEIKDEIVQYDNQLKNIQEALADQSGVILELLQEQENLYADAQGINLDGIKQLIENAKGTPAPKVLSEFIKKESDQALPKLKQISKNLVSIKEKLEGFLKENTLKLKDLISDITNIRVLIKVKIYNKLKVFCSLVEKHEEGMFNLEIVEKFPLVYEESLLEIKRRGAFKKDYLTMLGILESFANSENRFRQEFLEMYQQYLPKSFCPFLSKSFPQLKFDNIKRIIDQDLGIDLDDNNDQNNVAADQTSDTDVLSLLKNLNEKLHAKETRNQELENMVQPLTEENEMLKEQLKQRGFNIANMRRLFGATGFQEKIDEFLDSKKTKFTEKLDQLEQKLKTLQDLKTSSLEKLATQRKSTGQDTNERLKTILEENEKLLARIKTVEAEAFEANRALKAQTEEVDRLVNELVALRVERDDIAEDLQMIKMEKLLNQEKKNEDLLVAPVDAGLEKKEQELNEDIDKEAELQKQLGANKDMRTVLLNELGDEIISLAKVVSKPLHEKMLRNEYDLRELLGDIGNVVASSMACIDDFGVGDKVVAVRLGKKGKYFLILRKGMADLNVLHLYKPENPDKLEDAIIGEIEEFGQYQEDDITSSKANAVILVKMKDIEPLTSISL